MNPKNEDIMEDKNKVMTSILDAMSMRMAKNSGVGIKRSSALKAKKCVLCGKDATKFTDELSKKEFKISGMCQTCQDNFFD